MRSAATWGTSWRAAPDAVEELAKIYTGARYLSARFPFTLHVDAPTRPFGDACAHAAVPYVPTTNLPRREATMSRDDRAA